MPVAVHQCTVQMPIAIANHHPIGLDDEHPRRRIVLGGGRFVPLFDVRQSCPLLAFQLSSDAFSVCPQRLAAHLNAGQVCQ
jgi:hypothetical protein